MTSYVRLREVESRKREERGSGGRLTLCRREKWGPSSREEEIKREGRTKSR